MHYLQKKELFVVWLPGILANSNENYRHYNFQAFDIISGNFRNFWKFPKILNFRKIYNPSTEHLKTVFVTSVVMIQVIWML